MKRFAAFAGRVVVIGVILVALALFARSVEWAEVWDAVRSSSPLLLLVAALVSLLSVVLKGVRWWLFLSPVGAPSLPLAIRGTFVGAGLNNVLIANGGEAARVVYVARESGAPASGVLATLALERFFELLGYAFVLVLAVSLFSLPPALHGTRPAAIALLVVMVGLLVALLWGPRPRDLAAIEGTGMWPRARRFGRDFLRSLRSVSSGPRFAWALLVSLAVWALQVATYHLTALAAGLAMPLVATVACVLAVNIGFAVRATPGNVGVFQMMYAMTAAGFGVDRDLATGAAFLIQAQQILPVTLLAVWLAPGLLRGRRVITPDAA